MVKKRSRRKKGFARTRSYPLKNHPAFYRKRGNDDIEYITFTHSENVIFDNGEILATRELQRNINPKSIRENGKKSYAVPRVYTGKRSSLKNELPDYVIDDLDKSLIEELFNTSKRYPVSYTSNSKKKK